MLIVFAVIVQPYKAEFTVYNIAIIVQPYKAEFAVYNIAVIVQPYKAEFTVYNIVDTVFILLLALWCCVWS